MRRLGTLLALLSLPLLAGCGTLDRATEDKTQLFG